MKFIPHPAYSARNKLVRFRTAAENNSKSEIALCARCKRWSNRGSGRGLFLAAARIEFGGRQRCLLRLRLIGIAVGAERLVPQ